MYSRSHIGVKPSKRIGFVCNEFSIVDPAPLHSPSFVRCLPLFRVAYTFAVSTHHFVWKIQNVTLNYKFHHWWMCMRQRLEYGPHHAQPTHEFVFRRRSGQWNAFLFVCSACNWWRRAHVDWTVTVSALFPEIYGLSSSAQSSHLRPTFQFVHSRERVGMLIGIKSENSIIRRTLQPRVGQMLK